MKYLLKNLRFALVFLPLCAGYSQIKLPKLISDGLVLQRNEKVKIWGWASPNETITLDFKNKKYSTIAAINGTWQLSLPAQDAGGPYEMRFTASNTIIVKDILFGDVWVCSGQSNMELPMERLKEKYGEEIKNATNANIRQFLVPDKYNFLGEQTDFESGKWTSADPTSVLEFSGVGYFFAKAINEKTKVPVGIINSALGGSPIEAWMSEDALLKFMDAFAEAQRFKSEEYIKYIEDEDKNRSDNWYEEINKKDEGVANRWETSSLNDSSWEEIAIPSYWGSSSIGKVNGAVWFRKEITVPKEMVGKPAKLFLGRIVDQDFVYLNEQFVGTTGYQYPPRRYEVKEDVLKEGKNTIAVRVINSSGRGGFVEDKPYFLAVGNDTIDLKGTWKAKLGASMRQLQGPTFIRWKPTGLYNAMLAPLLNLKVKGVLWYQGESNTGDPDLYAKTLPALIKNWRTKWKMSKLPFLYVQLPNFMETATEPRESNWAQFRQSQLESLKVANTAMAVAIDLGEWNDIHPLNKKEVGDRLSLLARKLVYNEKKLNAASPMPEKTVFDTQKAIITFKNIAGGLVIKNGTELKTFAISRDGINFVWATAKIIGNTVEVFSTEITNPIAVRYAWDDNPAEANLYSNEGLPASPFEQRKAK